MKNRIRMIAGFAAAALILQGLALLFLTPGGIERLHPVAVRMYAEKIEPESNTYAVYYNTRVNVSDADLVVVGIDSEVAESYDLLGHFTRFLKQYNNFSHVLLDFDRVSKKLASGMINETREKLFYTRLDALKTQIGLSEDYCDYLTELFVVNSTMSPVRKFDLESYSSSANAESVNKAIRLADALARCDRSALCIVDAEELSSSGTFRKELNSLLPGKKILYVTAVYTEDCPSPETHEIISMPLTGSEPAVYFVENRKLESFYNYYSSVTGMLGKRSALDNPLDERYTDTFFVVANGTAVKYAETEEVTE